MMTTHLKFAILFSVIVLAFVSCASENLEIENKGPLETIENNKVRKPDSWIKERVEKAKTKLNSNEGGQLVWQSIEAHGGLLV